MKKFNFMTKHKLFITTLLLIILVFFLFTGCTDTSSHHDIITSKEETNIVRKAQEVEIRDISGPIKSTQSENTGEKPLSSSSLSVHFIDVGQGDCTLLIAPEGKTFLIDAGERGTENNTISYIKKQGINKIDVLIATHPHSDHIGGMADIIKTFDIGEIYMPKVVHTTKTFENLLSTIQEKGLKIKTAKVGVELDFDPNIKAVMVAPNSTEYDNLNDYSVVLKVTHGKNSFLITGDAEKVSEKEMVGNGYDLSSDVLKVGHHGSSTSTTDDFLNKVNPKYAVMSVGKNNDYGHPHAEIIDKFKNKGVPIYRTDEFGDIIITSDGTKLNFNNNTSTGKEKQEEKIEAVYIGNKNSKVFHLPSCLPLPSEHNQTKFSSRDEAVKAGLRPCKRCNP